MKPKWKYALIGLSILCVLLYIIFLASLTVPFILHRFRWHRVEADMKAYLESQDYAVLSHVSVSVWQSVEDEHGEQRDELCISSDSTQFTSELIADALLLKKSVETYLTEHPDVFSPVRVEIVIDDPYESGPHFIRIANYAESYHYSSADFTKLGYGLFTTDNGSIADFEGDHAFEYLQIYGCSVDDQLTVFDSMPGLQYLCIGTNEMIDKTALQDLINAHPDCTIVIDGESVHAAE